MAKWEHLFESDDNDAFRSLVNDLLSLDAASNRGMDEREYVTLARNRLLKKFF